MSQETVEVQGTVQADGALVLDGRLELPAGPVRVTVQPLPAAPDPDRFQAMMERIWAGQKARGHVPRSAEEVEAERRQVRDEWEERMCEIERIQEESRRLRDQCP